MGGRLIWTNSLQCVTPCGLSQCGVWLCVDRANAEHDNMLRFIPDGFLFEIYITLHWLTWWGISSWVTHLTGSLALRWLSWWGVSRYVDSFDSESHPGLTYLTGSLTLCWLSWQGVSPWVDSFDGESRPVLTQLTGSLTLCWLTWWGVSHWVSHLTGSFTLCWLSWWGSYPVLTQTMLNEI